MFPKTKQACIKKSKKIARKSANQPDELELRKLQDYIKVNINLITSNFELKKLYRA